MDVAALRRRERRDWLLFAVLAALVITAISASRWRSYADVQSSENTLLGQAGLALVQLIDEHFDAPTPPGAARPLETAVLALAALLAARDSADLRVTLADQGGHVLAGPTAASAATASAPAHPLLWQRTWRPPGSDRPLSLTLVRDRAAVFRQWTERTIGAAALWTTLFVIAAAVLALIHRRAQRDLALLREHSVRIAQAQRTVEISDERLRQVLRTASIGVFEHDHLTGAHYLTPEHNAIWGFAPDALPSLREFAERLHPDDRDRVLAAAAQGARPDGNGTFDSEHRIVRGDGREGRAGHGGDRGEVRWIRVRSQTMFEGSGGARQARRTVGGVTDVTDAHRAQQRLEQQAALLDRAQVAIDVRTIDNRLIYWNGGAERTYGWKAAEALGHDAAELLGHDPVQAAQITQRLLAQGEHAAILEERCRDGRTVQVDARFGLLRSADGRPEALFAIKTDITQRLQLEAQLRHAQRLDSLGQLTGGVAHDFNNLLTVIIGNADLLADALDQQPALQRLAGMARDAALRGAELTHGLLAFARRQPLQPRSVNVNERLAAAEGLLRRTLREDIAFELVRGAGLWPALIDPAQLESSILNLVINARDAMPRGGRITLETANAHIDQHYADQHLDVTRGQYVQISLSDTGDGMAADQLARAFEPFYTTKGIGKGTGLGLSMVHGFVKQSGGHIKLYSEPGHGTTVKLYLPRAGSEEAAGEAPVPATAMGPVNATVLVVEDDPAVRLLAHDLLVGLGYAVRVAGNGAEALAILQGSARIDLLFTDVVMPGGINGRELAERAAALRPGLKVLYTSGYTENAIVHQGRLDRGVHLLSKPYRRADLARAVHEVLG